MHVCLPYYQPQGGAWQSNRQLFDRMADASLLLCRNALAMHRQEANRATDAGEGEGTRVPLSNSDSSNSSSNSSGAGQRKTQQQPAVVPASSVRRWLSSARMHLNNMLRQGASFEGTPAFASLVSCREEIESALNVF